MEESELVSGGNAERLGRWKITRSNSELRSEDFLCNRAMRTFSDSPAREPVQRKRRPRMQRNASVLSFQGVVSTAATFLFKIEDLESPVTCLSLIGDNHIWMGTEKGCVFIWDKVWLRHWLIHDTFLTFTFKSSIQLLRTIYYHSSPITCMLSIGSSVWIGSSDKRISIWHQDVNTLFVPPYTCTNT